MNSFKQEISKVTNREKIKGGLAELMVRADIFIGVSAPDIVTKEMVQSTNPDPIIFAMANPIPEIHPDLAREAGAKVIGTGRSTS